MKHAAPIGIFDSGYGGLTVFKAIAGRLPDYDYLYLGDNARIPYGTRSFEAVYQFTLQGVRYLLAQGCSLVILACNTASAKALRQIQQLDLPTLAPEARVLGVLRPTTEVIGEFSHSGSIGIVATPGTVQSGSYPLEIRRFFPGLKVYQQACPLWVPLVENQEWDNPGGAYFLQKYLDALFAQSAAIDQVLLACTHYPVMAAQIAPFLPEGCGLISQGPIVARSLEDYLRRHPEIAEKCSCGGTKTFLTTDDSNRFDAQAPAFWGEALQSRQVLL